MLPIQLGYTSPYRAVHSVLQPSVYTLQYFRAGRRISYCYGNWWRFAMPPCHRDTNGHARISSDDWEDILCARCPDNYCIRTREGWTYTLLNGGQFTLRVQYIPWLITGGTQLLAERRIARNIQLSLSVPGRCFGWGTNSWKFGSADDLDLLKLRLVTINYS